MSELEQKRRYTDAEVSLIENTFKDQEGLLVLFRRFLLQGDLTKDEEKYLKQTFTSDVIAVAEKTINPQLDKNAVIGGTVDMFSGMDISPTPIEHAVLQVKARKKASQYLSQRFRALEGEQIEDEIIFDDLLEGIDDEEIYINLVVRNFLLSWIDTNGLRQLQHLAYLNETPEQVKERIKKNSNK